MYRLLAAAAVTAAAAFPLVAQETNQEAGADATAAAEAVATDLDESTVLAEIGDVDITLGHIIAAVDMLPEQYQALPDQTLLDGILDQMIQQQILAQDVENNIDRQVELVLENERRAVLAGTYMARVASLPITDEDAQAAYDESLADFDAGEEFNAAHILVETEEEALSVIEELEGGADFGELAAERSTGPSGPNGGDLGWFGMGMMVPEFEAAVVELEVGQVSPPVQTQFGWHVIILNDARAQEPPSLDDVRAQLEEQIRNDRVQAGLDALIAASDATKSEITIDPSAIRNIEWIE